MPVQSEAVSKKSYLPWAIILIIVGSLCFYAYKKKDEIGALVAGVERHEGATNGAPKTLVQSTKFASDTSMVATVRAAVLEKYPKTTIGNAFDGTFPDSQWSEEVTPKGVRLVTVAATVTPAFHRALFKKTYDDLEQGTYDSNGGVYLAMQCIPEEKLPPTNDASYTSHLLAAMDAGCVVVGSLVNATWNVDMRGRVTLESFAFSSPSNQPIHDIQFLNAIFE